MSSILFHSHTYLGELPYVELLVAKHNGRVVPHSHEFYEMVYVADGFTLHSTGSITNILLTGDIFFVKPGEEHSYINAYQAKLYNLMFDANELDCLRSELEILPGVAELLTHAEDGCEESESLVRSRLIHIPISERHDIERYMRSIETERQMRKVGWECAVRLTLAKLLIRYSRMYATREESFTDASDDYYGYLYKALRFINENYCRPFSMNELAEATGLSPDYMTKKFKKSIGMTASEYVRKFRIAKAMEMLCTTDLDIADVAALSGFSDVSLFSRVFRLAVGKSPAAYRGSMAEK